LLISPLNAFPWVINGLVEAHVSLKRVQRFINIQPTYLDEYYDSTPIESQQSPDIRIEQGNFSWNHLNDELVLKDIDLSITHGSLVLIVGRVGSGKTTLLNSILGELNKFTGSVHVRQAVESGFAYVSQEAWIQQMSFRDNILFGKTYDEYWYKKVIDACALENDIKVKLKGLFETVLRFFCM